MSEQDAMPEPTDSLGQMFRTARVSQGLTIGQMSTVIRIPEEALRDLEEDRFDQMSPLVFAKGKVRSYARALRLDEEHCVRLFAEYAGSFSKKTEKQSLMFPINPLVEVKHKSKLRRYLLIILVGVLLLVLLQVSTPQPSIAPHDRTGAVSESNERADANAGRFTSLSSPVRVAGSDDAPSVLELRASAETWARVHFDDGESREVLLQAGERVQWRSHDRFLLTLGNAGAVEILLNGRRQGPFGGIGVVVRDIELRP